MYSGDASISMPSGQETWAGVGVHYRPDKAQAFSATPMLSVIQTSKFAKENISLASIDTNGFVIDAYTPGSGGTYSFPWMAIGFKPEA